VRLPSAPDKFVLSGVVVIAGKPEAGWALMSVNGRRAEAVPVGAAVARGWRLEAVRAENALLLSEDGSRHFLRLEAQAAAGPPVPARAPAPPDPTPLAVELANREMNSPASD